MTTLTFEDKTIKVKDVIDIFNYYNLDDENELYIIINIKDCHKDIYEYLFEDETLNDDIEKIKIISKQIDFIYYGNLVIVYLLSIEEELIDKMLTYIRLNMNFDIRFIFNDMDVQNYNNVKLIFKTKNSIIEFIVKNKTLNNEICEIITLLNNRICKIYIESDYEDDQVVLYNYKKEEICQKK